MRPYMTYLPNEESGNDWRNDGGRPRVTESCTKNKLGKMQVSQPNNVKIYNLSAGKSLPEVRKGDD